LIGTANVVANGVVNVAANAAPDLLRSASSPHLLRWRYNT
jgi:hypothetical protein